MSIIRNAARAAGAGVLLTAAAAQGFTRYVTRGNRQTLEEAIRWQGEHYDIPSKDMRIIYCMWSSAKTPGRQKNM